MLRAPSTARKALSVLGFVAATAPGLLRAQTVAPVPRSAPSEETYEPVAEGLFRSGLRLFDAGDFDAACASLWASIHIDPKLGALLNLALCHEKQGRTATAWLEFAHAAAWAAELGQTNRHDFAVEHGAALEPRLFRVRLVLPAEPVLAVEVDGESLPGEARILPVFLDPGDHTITVSAPGRKPHQTILHVLPGANVEDLRVPALQAAPEVRLPPVSAPPSREGRRRAPLVLGGVGLVAFAFGAVSGAEAIAKSYEVGACSSAGSCSGPRDQARAWEIGSLVGFGLGAAALGVGLALWISAPPRSTRGASALLLRPVGSGAELGFVRVW
jgi:hypothetical protein